MSLGQVFAAASTIKRGTVLVVDDSFELRRLLDLILRKLSFEVLEAASGQEALDIANSGSRTIDLAIVDLIMPGMHGFDLIMALRSIPGRKQTRIFVLTGVADRQEEIRLKSINVDAYLLKPFSVATLANSLDSFFPKT